jgi:hypothetical protein
MPPGDYRTHFERKITEPVAMQILLIGIDHVDQSRLESFKDRISRVMGEHGPSMLLNGADSGLDLSSIRIHTIMNPNFHNRFKSASIPGQLCWTLNRPQSYWASRDVYIQLGFCREADVELKMLPEAIGLAMTAFDQAVVEHGPTEPESVQDIDIDPACVAMCQRVVGDHYREGIAVWNRHLVELRNAWLVTLRALVSGYEWQTAHERFVKSGGSYFLDKPEFWTEELKHSCTRSSLQSPSTWWRKFQDWQMESETGRVFDMSAYQYAQIQPDSDEEYDTAA